MPFKCPPLDDLQQFSPAQIGHLVAQFQHEQNKKFSATSMQTVAGTWRLWMAFAVRSDIAVLPITEVSRDGFLLDNAVRGTQFSSLENYRRSLGTVHRMAGLPFPWSGDDARALWIAAQKKSAQEHRPRSVKVASDRPLTAKAAPEQTLAPVSSGRVQESASSEVTPALATETGIEAPAGAGEAIVSVLAPSLVLNEALIDWALAQRHVNTSLDSLVRILEMGPSDTGRISTICRVIEVLAALRDIANGVKPLRARAAVARRLQGYAESSLTFDVAEVQRRLQSVLDIINRINTSQLLRGAADQSALQSMRGDLDWCVLKLSEAHRGKDGLERRNLDEQRRAGIIPEEVVEELNGLKGRVKRLEENWERTRSLLAQINPEVFKMFKP